MKRPPVDGLQFSTSRRCAAPVYRYEAGAAAWSASRRGTAKPAARAARSSWDTTARACGRMGPRSCLPRQKNMRLLQGVCVLPVRDRSSERQHVSRGGDLVEWSLRGLTRVVGAQYKATAPEIPQLSQPSMEPELAIVVVETGKAPGARILKLPICVVRVFRIGGRVAIRIMWFPSASFKYEISACT